MKHRERIRGYKRKTMEVNTDKEIKQCSNYKYGNTWINKVLELQDCYDCGRFLGDSLNCVC